MAQTMAKHLLTVLTATLIKAAVSFTAARSVGPLNSL